LDFFGIQRTVSGYTITGLNLFENKPQIIISRQFSHENHSVGRLFLKKRGFEIHNQPTGVDGGHFDGRTDGRIDLDSFLIFKKKIQITGTGGSLL
jgi:hypothetical protein